MLVSLLACTQFDIRSSKIYRTEYRRFFRRVNYFWVRFYKKYLPHLNFKELPVKVVCLSLNKYAPSITKRSQIRDFPLRNRSE